MALIFSYRKEKSAIFGIIYRPVAKTYFLAKNGRWIETLMIVDTGADYTLLPRSKADDLGIDLEKDCEILTTIGVGGTKKVYLYQKMKVRLGEREREIPVGFLDSDEIPPLLGRQGFMETFKTTFFKNHTLSFD